jgi:hypothetical protein
MMLRSLVFVLLTACGGWEHQESQEYDMADWGIDIIQNTSVTQMGGYSLEFVSGKTGESKTDYYPVITGRPYQATAWLRGTSIAGGNTCKADIEWYTAAKALISSTNIHATGILGAANTWEQHSVIDNAPATAAFAKVCVEKVAEAGGAWTLYCDYAGIEPFLSNFHVYRAGVHNIATATWTHVAFDTAVHDYGSMWVDSSTGAITVFADAGGGEVTVTSAGHGLAVGDLVRIYATTNYNGHFIINAVAANTYQITAAWLGDDGVGNWEANGTLVAPVTGIYDLTAKLALTVPVDTLVSIRLYKNNAQWLDGDASREGGAAGNVVTGRNVSAPGQLLTAGDVVDVRIFHDSGVNQALGVGSTANYFTASRR